MDIKISEFLRGFLVILFATFLLACDGSDDDDDDDSEDQSGGVSVNTENLSYGDNGPAGGVVFYINTAQGYGFEAAPSDQSNSDGAPWGCTGTDISGVTNINIGYGEQNTSNITTQCAETGSAAQLAKNYQRNGFGDWFLPSLEELVLLYDARNTVGGFASGVEVYYWASNEEGDLDLGGQFLPYPGGRASVVDFMRNPGHRTSFAKSSMQHVRAIRKFTITASSESAALKLVGGQDGGSVRDENGLTCESGCLTEGSDEFELTYTAYPDNDYELAHWSVCSGTSATSSCSITTKCVGLSECTFTAVNNTFQSISPSFREVNGQNVKFVSVTTGKQWRQVAGSSPNWQEASSQGVTANTFEETSRDCCSVYLFDASRNMKIQINLYLLRVNYAYGNNSYQLLNDITSASTRFGGECDNRQYNDC